MDTGSYSVDIDAQKVNFGGEWLAKDELAEKIRKMIESQDFKIGAAGNALEFLQKTMTSIRQAILAYLAAQLPLDTAIITEPAKPGEEPQAVELTEKKNQAPNTKVLVDPSLQTEKNPSDIASEDTWFRK
jgi:hypothetical protein